MPLRSLFILLFAFLWTFWGSSDPGLRAGSLDSLKKVSRNGSAADTARFHAMERICKRYWSGPFDSTFYYARNCRKLGRRIDRPFYQAKSLNYLGIGHLLSGTLDSAFHYFRRADSVARHIEEKKKRVRLRGNIHGNSGIGYKNAGKSDSALPHMKKALRFAKEAGDSVDIARQLINLGTVYKIRSNYPRAKELYLEATQMAKALEKPQFVAKANTNLGTVHQDLKAYEQALDRFQRSAEKFREMGSKRSLGEVLLNIGLAYQDLDSLEQAIRTNKEAMELARSLGDKRIIARANNNMGELYSRILKNGPDSLPPSVERMVEGKDVPFQEVLLDTIENIYKETVRYSEEHGFLADLSYAEFGLGFVAKERGNWEKAIGHYKRSYEAVKGQSMQKHLYDIHQKLARAYNKLGDHEKAYAHHQDYARIKDSVFNEKKSKELGRLDAKYAYEKKMLRRKKEAEKRRAKNRIIIYSMGGGLFLVILFSGLLVNRYRLIHKQKRTIEEQKDEVDRAYEELRERDQEISYSLDYAQSLQQALLPGRQELNDLIPGDGVLFFQPKEKVSGDFYWCNRASDGALIWVVADCTGHGIPGAFMSMMGVRLFNEAVLEKGESDPGRILDHVRNGIIHALGSEGKDKGKSDGMDAIVCSYSPKDGVLRFAGANNPLYLIHRGRNEELPEPDRSLEDEGLSLFEYKGDKMAVGAGQGEGDAFSTRRLTVEPADVVYGFSDGFADQFGGEKGKKFRYGPFKRLLSRLSSEEGAEQEKELERTFQDWREGIEQVDDVCILGVRFSGERSG